MMKETKQVLASDYWQIAPLETVQDLMEMDILNAPEVEIARALVRWGKAQVQLLDGGDSQDGRKLREKIEPCLKLIRFKGLHPSAFAQLSIAELASCLSTEEKFAILVAIELGDWKLMPVFLTPLKAARALK
jgi:hypothetical protein